ncbi:MAG TPA: acyltransferase [Desulfobacteria bacterium]|nr:acyltransferase [Desulfobacteria bacterium]
MRNLTRITFADQRNSMQHVFETIPLWRVCKNFAVVELSRYTPLLGVKNFLLRTFLGTKIGRDSSIGLMVMLDIIKPELITIGNNTIIGYNTTILAHEYLPREFRYGPVEIGENVLIGANCTILAGVCIGANAVVSAGTVVNRDVPANTMVGGNPMRVIKQVSQ